MLLLLWSNLLAPEAGIMAKVVRPVLPVPQSAANMTTADTAGNQAFDAELLTQMKAKKTKNMV
jgi:hypothetical protein